MTDAVANSRISSVDAVLLGGLGLVLLAAVAGLAAAVSRFA
jgi:hypothetical protein